MKKIYIFIFLFLLMLFKNNIIASEINISKCNVKLCINEGVYELSDVPLNINNSIYISILDIQKIFGFNYNIDDYKKEVKLSYKNLEYNSLDFTRTFNNIIEYNLYIEEEYRGISYFYNNIIYIPLRIVADRGLCDIEWNANTNVINLNYNISNIKNGELLCLLNYTNSLSYNYMFMIYQGLTDRSKFIYMMEYDGIINSEFDNLEELFKRVDIKKINDRKIIYISDEKYQILNNKINNLLNDKNRGNKLSSWSASYQCDFSCYIIFNEDNYNTAFKSYPELETTLQYNELKKYFKDISGYDMQYITPYNM